VWGDTGRVALVPVNTATCKTTHMYQQTIDADKSDFMADSRYKSHTNRLWVVTLCSQAGSRPSEPHVSGTANSSAVTLF
jgi:hypothetical protein